MDAHKRKILVIGLVIVIAVSGVSAFFILGNEPPKKIVVACVGDKPHAVNR
jgi:hypothetical protein